MGCWLARYSREHPARKVLNMVPKFARLFALRVKESTRLVMPPTFPEPKQQGAAVQLTDIGTDESPAATKSGQREGNRSFHGGCVPVFALRQRDQIRAALFQEAEAFIQARSTGFLPAVGRGKGTQLPSLSPCTPSSALRNLIPWGNAKGRPLCVSFLCRPRRKPRRKAGARFSVTGKAFY